ncbi:MAG: hypothetical protein Q4E53_11385 [Eubacteriales bacterium]|nr:hypothetical protein [Eubacteriales bacterium]
MNPWIITAIILIIGGIAIFFLYKKGNKMQAEQQEQKEKLVASAQKMTMLIIDKKRLPLKESGLPQMVIDQSPKRAQRAKVPVVKAKVGPKIMSLVADEDIYDLIPVNASVHAMVSGIYITSINNYRKAPVVKEEKKGFFKRLISRK